MNESDGSGKSSEAASMVDRRRDRNEAIGDLISRFAACDNEDLLFQMMVTVCRLAADNADRGDLKMLNAALKEVRYALKVFAPYAAIRKVSMFGSARTPPDHPHYHEARKFAELIQGKGWMVITGAGDGIMRAGHHGASRAASFGVAISLPFEQATNTFIADDPKLVTFKYFFTRKLMFVKEADAIILFPGGFGTMDEGFEALTLVQTGKTVPTPIVLCDQPGGDYWVHWRNYVESQLLGSGMIDPEDMDLFHVTDSARDAVDHIAAFYRCYHSSRWVGDQMVLRLNHALPTDTLLELTDTFHHILTEGRFVQIEHPLDEEDGALPDKPRLVFSFNRRAVGGLRRLIDRINRP
ncbi:MAG: LOG family protein [Phycisphaerae bacterium]